MKKTRNYETLKRQYETKGVKVIQVMRNEQGYPIADGFICNKCGKDFYRCGALRNVTKCPHCKP